MYSIPKEYYIRLHHVRPRFKNDIENVLIFMASEISKIPECSEEDFKNKLNTSIYLYPGNSTKTLKTINNWRTEISSLFSFVETKNGVSKPSLRAKELYHNEDLVEAFKKFLYTFQYPGAHIKSHEVLKLIENGVKFKPAQTILKVLKAGEKATGKHVGISKAEACHCIFNDLRCVRDHENPIVTWKRIEDNRNNHMEYDTTGDVIRYAGDILDYMEIANLLKTYDSKMFYINTLENESVIKFINSSEWFDGYDEMISRKTANLSMISKCEEKWVDYVNRDLSDTDFSTDILAYIADDSSDYENLKEQSKKLFAEKLDEKSISTKDIGDMGEGLVHSHECERIRIAGRTDLIHLIKRIPTSFAVGYDIQSVETDERKRYIEVKTTISQKPLHFNKIHLTPNEWNTANTTRDRYFVYRLGISKTERKLFIIQDPVGLYKNDVIDMIPKDGAEIVFDVKTAGKFEELLSWAN